jgi:Response regulator containing CheY-like receiver domain and AraC-type DNA-binding domain
MKVLIVDDEPNIRQGLSAMLAREGLAAQDILEAENGQVALDLFREERPWFVITDIRMALRSGLDFLESLGERASREAYIAVLSGYDDFAYAQRAMRAGAREYILKPISREDLASSLRRATEAFRAFHENEAGLSRNVDLQRENALRYALLDESFRAPDYARLAEQGDFGPLLDVYRVYARRREPAAQADDRAPRSDSGELRIVDPLLPYLELRIKPEEPPALSAPAEGIASGPVSGYARGLADFPRARAEAVDAWKTVFVSSSPGSDRLAPAAKIDLADELESFLKHPELAGSKAEQDLALAGMLDPSRLRGIEPGRLGDAFALVAHELGRQDGRAAELADPFAFASLDEALGRCLRIIEDWAAMRSLGLGEIPGAELSKSRRLIEEAVQYVQSHYSDSELTMAVVSNRLSLSYSYFSELFKSVTGKNFAAYLRQLRIAQSRVLLRETNLMVEEIASKVGYADAKVFSKVFRADVGSSPSEYRLAERDII